ncbi:class I SAM-dependent methyltransferase [Roseomonas arctica]|uniref:Class I SAM-dependent methyltransferase n=1 Tax=Plastoroseomonas arctica TaxID=1509237 RepID=A0AAF1JWU9_9PROT|nr:class I SAM-dependent methyltransferase [Plastoroseomonas arctica]
MSMLTPGSFGLDIGPSYNLLLPKSEGFNIETVDYADQATLRSKYASTVNVDIARIEVVDHVTGGRPLTETIPPDRAYDFILASHVIGHTPDLIGFLADCARFLRPGGRLVLAVLGKRFWSDLIHPLTSVGRGAAGTCRAADPAHADGSADVGRLRRAARLRRDRLVAAGGPSAGLRRQARQGNETRRACARVAGVCGRALLALRSIELPPADRGSARLGHDDAARGCLPPPRNA